MTARATGTAPEAAERQGFAFTATLLFVVMGVALVSQLPIYRASRPSSAYGLIWPQSWGFFAGAADKPVVVAFLGSSADGPREVPGQRHLSAAGGWGVRRSSDTLQAEILYLTAALPAAWWTPCTAAQVSACPITQPYRATNAFPAPRLCGRVTLARLGPDDRRTDPGGTGRPLVAVLPAELACPAR